MSQFSPFTRVLLLLVAAASQAQAAAVDNNPPGFVPVPESGIASTTEFPIGSEFPVDHRGPTACGVIGLPGSAVIDTDAENHTPMASDSVEVRAGNGPGYLYAAINELGFGSNQGAGPACGVCYNLTPLDANNNPIPNTDLTFMIVDSCPQTLTDGSFNAVCSQCKIGQLNNENQQWHFDIATDAMNSDQYNRFYPNKPKSDGNYNAVQFTKTACDPQVNPTPPIATSGCISGSCQAQSSNAVCNGAS